MCLQPTLPVYLALIHACGMARDSTAAFRVLSEMNKQNITPDVRIYSR